MISVIDCDPRYDSYHDLKELPAFILKEIKNFFDNYKVLQKVEVTTGDYHDKEEAVQIIEECRARFQEDI